MRFRLTFYNTDSDNKFDADSDYRHEYLGSARDIWNLWYLLHKEQGKKHVVVYSLNGIKQEPEKGLAYMTDCAL